MQLAVLFAIFRGVQLAKMTLVWFLVRFCFKKLRFSILFRFHKISCGFGFSGSVKTLCFV